MGKKHRSPGICVYCGEYVEKRTEEHVFPKALFPTPQQKPIKISVCQPCNRLKSVSDKEFRYQVALTEGASSHPEALRIMLGPFFRELPRRTSRFVNQMEHAALEQVTPDGLVIPPRLVVDSDPDPRAIEIGCMSLGLINHLTGRVVVNTHAAFIKDLDNGQFERIWGMREEENVHFGVAGERVVEWTVTTPIGDVNEQTSFGCAFRFYGVRSFFALFSPKIACEDSHQAQALGTAS